MQAGAVLALTSAVAFGLCDFLAGLASRRLSFWWVALVSLAASVIGAWVVVVLSGRPAAVGGVLWGCGAGLGAAVGSSALYRGYGRGQMAVAGPLSAVGAVALPAIVGAVLGERLPVGGLVGVLVAMPAIWLVSSAGGFGGGVRRGAIEGLASGAGFALEFVGLQRAGGQSGLWPVAVSQSTALVLIAAVVGTHRPTAPRQRGPLSLAVAAGLLSLAATSLYFAAAHAGLLTVAAVLASLYPAVTVVLAVLLVRERPDRPQVLGLILGAIAVVLIVLG